MTDSYDLLAESSESTVVARYERPQEAREESYQSEAQLEKRLIEQLEAQGYERADITGEAELIANLRRQLEALNDYKFTDNEWRNFFKGEIAAEQGGIEAKARTIQQDYVKVLHRDDGTDRNIRLIDKHDIHANRLQVINQYKAETGGRKNRYDVTILVNGLPLVHIELKRRGRDLREAFNQIDRYGRETFCGGSGLFEYVQVFVISNGTLTKYYSNTTRESRVKEAGGWSKSGKPRPCQSFEFTSYWADGENKPITDLEDFTQTFFSRHTLLSVLTRYCVLTEERLLLVMRPYQIAATERLLNRVEMGHNQRLWGTRDGGGYVWHTTGSGKTLTSFKAAQLATGLEYVEKVFFVVDRKDLDYQTMKEYDRFQKGAANGNTSTRELTKQIGSSGSKIIITTIQKLTNFVKQNKMHSVYGKEVVLIFDECHRSQFGAMHKEITKRFKKYYIFGFTGTPIFRENIVQGNGLRTTDDVFGRRLHTYTIVDAIRDHNVLPFRLDYISTIKEKEEIEDKRVYDIAREKALNSRERIQRVSEYVIEHFDQQTKRGESYLLSTLANVEQVARDGRKQVVEERRRRRLDGFNSMLAVESIESAKLYYAELKRQVAELPPNRRLKVATIFTYAANEAVEGGMDDENPDSAEGLDESSRDFLEKAIADYNEMFGTSYDTSAEKFPNYYKDVSLRMKNREIDLLVVVNMFLTGFDATTLNTLWVDKNLRYHGLLQAFSRTNRILNSVKKAGNIVCFRNLEDATNRALSLFGDKDARSTVLLRRFEDYFYGYDDEATGKHVAGYTELVEELAAKWKPGVKPEGEAAKRAFIALFGSILRSANLLSCFDRFGELNPLSERDRQDYTSVYIELRDELRPQREESENINDDVVFEMELVKHVEVTIDYILYLVELYHESHCEDGEIRLQISRAIGASPDLRDKKELIMAFVDSLTPGSAVDDAWLEYVNGRKLAEFEVIVEEERLRRDKAVLFMERAFELGYVPEGGMELASILPALNPFDPSANRGGVMERVLERLKAFFRKFYGIGDGDFGALRSEE